jgi:lipoprotein-releasing system permease protein
LNPWTPIEWITAVRFLKEGRLQTIFILTGITIGVAVIVFMSAMLAGLQANFIKRVLTSQPHIQLLAPDEVARPLRQNSGDMEAATIQRPTQRTLSIDQWPKIRDLMKSNPEVTAVSPTVSGSVLAIRGEASRSVTITGMDPNVYFQVVRIPDYIVAGEARLASDDIIIGTQLADDLGVSIGDKLNVQAASGANRILTVTGIVDLGSKGANQRAAYVVLRTAQSLLNLVGGATTIDLTIRDIYDAEKVAQQIQSSIPVQADSWIKNNVQFFTAVNAQRTTNTLIRLFVGLSVAFGITAVLVVSVIQRSKDIGILRAMGTPRRRILLVFLIQGGLLGLLGSIVGSVLGAAALIFWHSYARQADGGELFPLFLDSGLFIASTLLATVTGVLAAMVPAIRAANLDPVVAIRG